MGELSQAARYPVRGEEDTGAARRAAGSLAGRAGVAHGQVEVVVTELAANLVRHATGGGYLLCQAGPGWLEILSVDHGPGLRRGDLPPPGPGEPVPPPLPVRPGASLGAGLGAVRRLAQGFDCYSGPAGTVILARFGAPEPAWPGLARWGAVNIPLGGAGVSGDGWAVTTGRRLAALVADGLGHGPSAGAAAAAAVSALTADPEPAEFVTRAHEAMLGTRGAVLGIGVIDPARGELAYAGVGNISGRTLPPRGPGHGLVSREGALGTELAPRSPRVTRLPWEPGSTLILASDGIRSDWDPPAYPGLLERDPAVIAAVLYRDHERGTDDATVLVVQDVRRS